MPFEMVFAYNNQWWRPVIMTMMKLMLLMLMTHDLDHISPGLTRPRVFNYIRSARILMRCQRESATACYQCISDPAYSAQFSSQCGGSISKPDINADANIALHNL